MFKLPETTCFQQAGWNGHGKLAVFFHIPNDRRICRIYGHHQKNVLILPQCIAMWEERKIHVVPISLWLSVLYTKFHPSKKKTFFCPRQWQWPLVRHQLAFAFTSESSPFLSSCWLSFIQIYVSKMKDDTLMLMLCKCWQSNRIRKPTIQYLYIFDMRHKCPGYITQRKHLLSSRKPQLCLFVVLWINSYCLYY